MGKHEGFPSNPQKYKRVSCDNGDTVPSWKIYQNTFANYLRDFAEVDPDQKIVTKLETKKDPVVIDLMGSTDAVSSLQKEFFPSGILKKKTGTFVAVGLDDDRDEVTRRKEASRGIEFIYGNLTNKKTWDKIESTIGEENADIVMERGYGGLWYVPTRPLYQKAVMNRMWKLLSPDGGILAVQTPPEDILEKRGFPIGSWLTKVAESGIMHNFVGEFCSLDGNIRYGMLLLQKNSPEEQLPDL